MSTGDFVVFALNASRGFGERVARHLGAALGEHEERNFENGEHKARPLVNVRNKDTYVIQWLFGDGEASVNDKLCRLLFFIGALKDASARSTVAVVPYLCYARKDRKTKPRDPVITRYIAQLFEAVGTYRVVTLDVHNPAAFENAFRRPTEHLTALPLLVDHFKGLVQDEEAVAISPDIGGAKRAERFAGALSRALGREVATAFVEKYRSEGVVSGGALAGEVKNRTAIIIDDMISSGGTILRAARACHELGATRVYAAATHGVFSGDANAAIADPMIERVTVTNTVPPLRLDPALVRQKLTMLDSSGLVAEAIKRIQTGGSLSDMSKA